MNREEITAELHKFLTTHCENVECDTCLNVFDDLRNLVADICEEKKVIDWEQRRYEIAKDILAAQISDSKSAENNTEEVLAKCSVTYADALIKELKGGTQ